MGNMQSNNKKKSNIYLITYNCHIKNFSNYKSNRLLNYILNYKNNNFVLCLQGLYDKKTIEYIEDNIKNQKINKIKSSYENGLYILCTYDITSIEQEKFLIKDDIDIIDGKKGFITFNIGLNNNLVSIYNTELQNDISNNLLFNEIRLNQISQILLYITKKKITECHLKLHIIMGSFYMENIKSNKLCDVMSLLENSLETNVDDNKKEDYILFFTEIKYDSNEIIKYMKEKYGIMLMDVIIRTDINISKNLPCELVLKIIDE